jgi:hypothetical protein
MYGQRFQGYDTAQVCNNGHVITQFAETRPQHQKKFCNKCGAPTITQCPKCTHAIQGYYHNPGVAVLARREPPAFCHNCGAPYPWTEQRLAAAKQLIEESGKLTQEENAQFEESLQDLVRQTPKTPLAVSRFNKFMAKAGNAVATGTRDILVDVLSEAVKKQIWG